MYKFEMKILVILSAMYLNPLMAITEPMKTRISEALKNISTYVPIDESQVWLARTPEVKYYFEPRKPTEEVRSPNLHEILKSVQDSKTKKVMESKKGNYSILSLKDDDWASDPSGKRYYLMDLKQSKSEAKNGFIGFDLGEEEIWISQDELVALEGLASDNFSLTSYITHSLIEKCGKQRVLTAFIDSGKLSPLIKSNSDAQSFVLRAFKISSRVFGKKSKHEKLRERIRVELKKFSCNQNNIVGYLDEISVDLAKEL